MPLPQQRLGSPQLLPKLAVHSGASCQAIPKNVADREGLTEVCQRRHQQLPHVGMAERRKSSGSAESRRSRCSAL